MAVTAKLAPAGLLTVIVTALLSQIVSANTGLSFLAGCAIGAGSFVAVAFRVRTVFSRHAALTRSTLIRLLGGFMLATYYLLLTLSVYLLVRVAGASVLWLVIGYTWALVIFAIYMATSGRKRPHDPTVSER